MKNAKLLDEICLEDGCNREYCFLKDLMLHNGLEDKMVMQLKLVNKFKYDWSKEAGHDIGYEATLQRWTAEGYAKRYTEYWNSNEHTHHITSMYNALKKNESE